MKWGSCICDCTEYSVEHHAARAGAEKFTHQQRPNFARPWIRMRGHQSQRRILGDLIRINRIQDQRLLIDSEKNKIRMSLSFATFTAQHIGKTSLAAPDGRKKRSARKKMRQGDQA